MFCPHMEVNVELFDFVKVTMFIIITMTIIHVRPQQSRDIEAMMF